MLDEDVDRLTNAYNQGRIYLLAV